MDQESIIKEILEKYKNMGENPEMYLKGFLNSKPLTYWDYVKVDLLLSLQQTETDYPDEEIFIMYSQITELLLKSMIIELKQITGKNDPSEEILSVKINRLNRYTELLIAFFRMMSEGIDYEQYSKFRLSLAPASGFQSVQFRYIELYSTRLENLINEDGRKRLTENHSVEDCFENIYWKDAGINRNTGKKTLTLQQFEKKYQDDLVAFAKDIQGNTLEDKILKMPGLSTETYEKLKKFDHLYNVDWPLVHIKTASHFLEKKGETKKGTGGSEWKKYLHPESQQRKFFPSLLSAYEQKYWGY